MQVFAVLGSGLRDVAPHTGNPVDLDRRPGATTRPTGVA